MKSGTTHGLKVLQAGGIPGVEVLEGVSWKSGSVGGVEAQTLEGLRCCDLMQDVGI